MAQLEENLKDIAFSNTTLLLLSLYPHWWIKGFLLCQPQFLLASVSHVAQTPTIIN